MGVLDSVLGFLGDMAGPVISAIISKGNMDQVAKTNVQNLELQKEQWNREDTSYQRKIEDLKAAGINPVMAAGGAGEPTSLSTKIIAPQFDNDFVNKALQSRVIQQQFARTKADADLTKANAEIQSSNADYANVNNKLNQAILDENAKKAIQDRITATNLAQQANIKTQMMAHDWEIYDRLGALTNVGGDVAQMVNAGSIISNALNTIFSKAGNIRNR